MCLLIAAMFFCSSCVSLFCVFVLQKRAFCSCMCTYDHALHRDVHVCVHVRVHVRVYKSMQTDACTHNEHARTENTQATRIYPCNTYIHTYINTRLPVIWNTYIHTYTHTHTHTEICAFRAGAFTWHTRGLLSFPRLQITYT